jgi:hypothetical protein
MTKDPWTDSDPQPGDFDADLATIDPHDLQVHPGNRDAQAAILVSIEGEDAKTLERLAAARGLRPGEVVAALLHEAEL